MKLARLWLRSNDPEAGDLFENRLSQLTCIVVTNLIGAAYPKKRDTVSITTLDNLLVSL